MTTVFDYSFARPPVAALVDAGGVGVARYLSTVDHTKNLTPSERDALHAAGLAISLVFEDGAHWSTWKPGAANMMADALGWPLDRPIYFAADTDLSTADYLAVSSALFAGGGHRPRGIYGESGLVDFCLRSGAAQFGWIAASTSWSHVPAPGACLVQRVGSPVPGTDRNDVLKPDWGGWLPGHDNGGLDDMTPEEVRMQATAGAADAFRFALGLGSAATPADVQRLFRALNQAAAADALRDALDLPHNADAAAIRVRLHDIATG